jgi:hypothetical protein
MMRLIFEDRLPRHRLQLAKFDPRGRRLALLDAANADMASMFVYERTDSGWRQLVDVKLTESALCLAFSPDGSSILLSTEAGLLMFDIRAQSLIRFPILDGGGANELEWFDNERVVAAYSERWPPACIFSLRDNKNRLSLVPPMREVAKHIPRIAPSHDGATIAFCHAFEFVFLFDTRTGDAIQWNGPLQLKKSVADKDRPWEWTHFARRIWFSADDREIAVASQPRDRTEWDEMDIRSGMRNGSNQRLLRVKSHMGSVDMRPDFEVVAAAVIGKPGEVALWDARTSIVRDTIHVSTPTRDIRFSPDGQRLVIACEERFGIFER